VVTKNRRTEDYDRAETRIKLAPGILMIGKDLESVGRLKLSGAGESKREEMGREKSKEELLSEKRGTCPRGVHELVKKIRDLRRRGNYCISNPWLERDQSGERYLTKNDPDRQKDKANEAISSDREVKPPIG